jgi:hypothetical protein
VPARPAIALLGVIVTGAGCVTTPQLATHVRGVRIKPSQLAAIEADVEVGDLAEETGGRMALNAFSPVKTFGRRVGTACIVDMETDASWPATGRRPPSKVC